ncbi:histidine phosphatase superfamily [Armillaria fumosa]|nr:histidine phosphatase superfamily [Armillaria fumosa]
MPNVLGVIVLARNGDRLGYVQDPATYLSSSTHLTPLGAVQSHQLGSYLRSTYLNPSSPSYITGLNPDLVNPRQVKVRAKAGGEGDPVFDSTIALLQGLFPPTPRNSIVLANESVVTAPLGGYQYVPVETVEPGNDRSLEPWTSCPAFLKRVAQIHASEEFKAKEKETATVRFFDTVKDYVFGRERSLANIWNIYDFMQTQLTYNQTYAYRLPPSLINTARALANYHEDLMFSDDDINGIGNIAARTLLHTILTSLERIAFDGDPLQLLLIESSYHPFISFFHATDIVDTYPELKGIPDPASSLMIELIRGAPPDTRDFLRFKFMNGSHPAQTVHVFGHRGDIPLTEFIYKSQDSVISNNRQWREVCTGRSASSSAFSTENLNVNALLALGVFIFALFALGLSFKWRANKKKGVKLAGEEVSTCNVYGYGACDNGVGPVHFMTSPSHTDLYFP